MSDPDEGPDDNIKWYNFWDCRFNTSMVWGLALIKHGFKARLHCHNEMEKYFFLYGEGCMQLGEEQLNVVSPRLVEVPGGVKHAMTPVSNFVLLLYCFPKANKYFEDIKYIYLDEFISKVTYPSQSMFSCPVSEEEEFLVRTSKL